jgi:hypothetical protein
MSRLLNFVVAMSAGSISAIGFQVAPAHAATPAVKRALLTGELGIEGGAYPGTFHPTAGTVEVEFDNQPLSLVKKVGRSGQFRIPLEPGSYTVIGCGPSASSRPGSQCSKAQDVTLTVGEVDYVQLVWEYAP